MAVLPWGHSRTRTTSNEKRSNFALEWFARSGASEPSRQALTLLMKQHTKTVSEDSTSRRGDSRSSTAQSHHSKQSQDSSAASIPSASISSRPSSPRPASPAYSVASAFERPDTLSKSLFSRGNSLRRQGSKMSINSETGTSSGVVSPSRFSPSRLGFRRKDSVPSPTSVEKQSWAISQPFSFQHVTHTEQNHFTALSRIDESELATHFGALQASQRAEHGLRGIQANSLSPIDRERPCSPPPPPPPPPPTPAKTAELPMTPPRPAPPPKNSPRIVTSAMSPDVRMSRSMENFSRPTPRSPSTPTDASPGRLLPSHLPPVLEAESSPGNVVSKPLPHLPSIVHAVSTEDGSARRLINAPLPVPPRDHSLLHGTGHRRQVSSKNSLRHMSTFPSPRDQRLPQHTQDLNLVKMSKDNSVLPRHRSQDILSQSPSNLSIEYLESSPVDDWERAIDFAWDHADDQSLEEDSGSDITSTVVASADESLITVHQPEQPQVSLPSTPLMMGPSDHLESDTESFDDERELHDAVEYQVLGLGINSGPTSRGHLRGPQQPALALAIPEDSEYNSVYQLPRTTYSALSKSSSQESIILSIASSIMGTQRSSNSSVNPADLARLSKYDEPVSASASASASSPFLNAEKHKAARPESACVPVSLLRGFTTSENEIECCHSGRETCDPVTADVEEDVVPPLPLPDNESQLSSQGPSTSHQRQPSLAALNARVSRKRSSTQTSRRNVRASYSLFPSASSLSLSSQEAT